MFHTKAIARVEHQAIVNIHDEKHLLHGMTLFMILGAFAGAIFGFMWVPAYSSVVTAWVSAFSYAMVGMVSGQLMVGAIDVIMSGSLEDLENGE